MKLIARSGFLEVYAKKNSTVISFTGNMGNRIQDVDDRLKALGFQSIDKIKKNHEVISEEGDPSYCYTLEVQGILEAA